MRQLIFVAVLLCVQWAFGQNNFKKGYIVTTAGDTLQGEINFNWNLKPSTLSFRQGAFSNSYDVDDVSSFQIKGGDLFVQRDVELDASPTVLDKLLEIGQDQMEPARLFLKVLVLGNANLYQSYDEKRQRLHYFIETADSDGTVELIENRRKVPRDTEELGNDISRIAGLVKTQDKYKQQLTYLLQSCDRSFGEIQKMDALKQKAIMKVIESFNTCYSNQIVYRQDKKLNGTKFELGIMAGMQLMDVVLESEFSFSGQLNTDPYLTPIVGLDAQFFFSNRRVLSMSLQAYYSRFETSETFFERRAVVSGFSTINYEWEQFTNQVKFNFNFGVSDKFFFANTGFGINWIGNAVGDKSFDTGSQSSVINQNKDSHLMLSFGGGYQHKKLRAALDFDIGSSSKQLRFSDTRTLNLKVSYFLF